MSACMFVFWLEISSWMFVWKCLTAHFCESVCLVDFVKVSNCLIMWNVHFVVYLSESIGWLCRNVDPVDYVAMLCPLATIWCRCLQVPVSLMVSVTMSPLMFMCKCLPSCSCGSVYLVLMWKCLPGYSRAWMFLCFYLVADVDVPILLFMHM